MITMESKDDVQALKEAKAVICRHCESDMCEWCQVTRIVDDAEADIDDDHEYISCSTFRDYGPSNPWDAPGMSVSDFI